MRYLADSPMWQYFDFQYPEFAKECRNMRLGLVTDDFNTEYECVSLHKACHISTIQFATMHEHETTIFHVVTTCTWSKCAW